MRLALLIGSIGVVFAGCSSQSLHWHPVSYYVREGVVPFHQRIVAEGDHVAIVAGTFYPTLFVSRDDNGKELWHGHGTRVDVEVMSHLQSQPIPDGDVELARKFVRRACRELDLEALMEAEPKTAPGGYYVFEGVGCSFFASANG